MAWHGHFTIRKKILTLNSFIIQCLTNNIPLIKKLIFLLVILSTVLIYFYKNHPYSKNVSNNYVSSDLDYIRNRGKLIAITDNNSTNYFIYKGEPMGFHYELLKSFSDNIGVDIEIITENNRKHASDMLNTGEADHSRSGTIVRSDYYASNAGKISQYDDMIMRFSKSIKWDWRLLASLIYQESRFEADVISQAGAYGLMQIMPVTGRHFGIDVTTSPENNLKVGILFIKGLNSFFDSKIYNEDERLNFILAAYNAGPGHVLDAMKLAEKNGMDSHKWNGNVAFWLLKMADPLYYKDKVVKNGYFRGVESVKFVSEVRDRFAQYKNIIPSKNAAPFKND
jgi:membrane-bound lytic murein transglycosylase MltF